MLHITNGDCAGERIAELQLGGTILPWRDVLHEGPVPALPLEELSRRRAEFIAASGWGSFESVYAQFLERDALLRTAAEHDEVVLWFEHDLYDQLQLLQLLHWFSSHPLTDTRLTAVSVEESLRENPALTGLAELPKERLLQLYAERTPVSEPAIRLGRQAWEAFCAPEPLALLPLTRDFHPELPFLQQALTRHLEQFPRSTTGLSRTEQTILEILSSGALSFAALFKENQKREEARYLGDTTFASYLQALLRGPEPPISFDGERYGLTAVGEAILLEKISVEPERRRLGGVAQGAPHFWYWDPKGKSLVKKSP